MIIKPPQFVLERLGMVKKNRNKNFEIFYYDEMLQDSLWQGIRFVESPALRDNQWFISHDATFMIRQEEE